MKKLLLYAIIISFSFSVIGCGKSSEPETASEETTAPEEETTLSSEKSFEIYKKAVEEGLPGATVNKLADGIEVEYHCLDSQDETAQLVVDHKYSSSYMLLWDEFLDAQSSISKKITSMAQKAGINDPVLYSVYSNDGKLVYAIFRDGELQGEIFQDKER